MFPIIKKWPQLRDCIITEFHNWQSWKARLILSMTDVKMKIPVLVTSLKWSILS